MFVYAMRGGGYAKIGVSDDIEKRLASFNSGTLPFEMSIVCLAEADTMTALEIEADVLGTMPRLRGEWVAGAVSDNEIVSAFDPWRSRASIIVQPTLAQVVQANRTSARQRQLEASRSVARAIENEAQRGADWHRIATELTARGEIGALRKVKKAFKSKMLAAKHRAAG